MQNMTRIIILYILPVIFFLIFHNITGCAGKIEEKPVNPESGKVNPPQPNKSMPPGTARIEAQLIDLSKKENQIECIVKVEKVLQYGGSVKPIGRGTHLTLIILKEQDDLINILDRGTLKQKYEFTVEQEEVVNISSRQVKWRALGIHDLKPDK
jgi:hypothetical protein